jgi:hypothetical protein
MAKKIKEEIQSRPIGRPSKYKPEFCQLLIDHMADGFTFESFAGVAEVDRDTIYEWVDAHSDFSDAKKVGRARQLYANEKLIKDIAKFGDGNATAAIFILKNCHPKDWRDRREIDLSPPKNMSKEEIIAEAKALIAAQEANELKD